MIINITQPLTLVLITFFAVLMIFLGKETKKSFVPGISLGAFLILLVYYVFQMITMTEEVAQVYSKTLVGCLVVTFLLVLISYLGYLWVDTIDAKENNKKSYGEDLDWLWKKV